MDREIDKQIEEISGSAIEFRKSIDKIIFARLNVFFKAKGREISRESKIMDLFDKPFTPSDWYELEDIGLKVPDLRRHRAFNYVTTAYVLTAIIIWTVTVLTNLDTISAVWTLPLGVIASAIFFLTFSPVLAFMAIFSKRLLPVENVDNLIERIIAENWSDLLTDDKKLFREIVEPELTVVTGPVDNKEL